MPGIEKSNAQPTNDQTPKLNVKDGKSSPSENTPTEKGKFSKSQKLKISPEIRNSFKKIIIHLHGGGFIAMSSSYHQGYIIRLFEEDVEKS